MSAQQLGKIQALEKQFEAVERHPGATNIKKTPAFIHMPDMKANYKQFERIGIASTQTYKTVNATIQECSSQKSEHISSTD
jgi:hypothetical protein